METIFTRYLYLYSDVAISLKWAILSHKRDEALFWAYELYWSGFEKEIFAYLLNLAKLWFTDQPKFIHYLEKLAGEYDGKNYEIIASIVSNLIIRKISTNRGRQFYVRSSRKTADEYLTIEKTHYKHLAIVSKYGINLEKIMEEKQKQNIDDSYLNNWLFYASYSPIWKSRIETYNGKINLEQKRVEFRDDDLEEFYDKYGFEPDEMNMETHHKHGVMLSK